MILEPLDWAIMGLFFIILLTIGYATSRQAGKSTTHFFLSGRNMPWWLLGISMVATTFSADTPNLVTDMVRTGGVASNWQWWAFLLTGMLTVFVYAKLWNRSRIMTDLEFYELRYSGKMAAFLRGFRAVYLGFFFNVMVIATVSLAFIKISAVMLGIQPAPALIIAALIVVFYSGLGGLKSILWTDLFQFSFALFGAVIAAFFVVRSPEIGGLTELFTHPNVVDNLSFVPSISQPELFVSLFLIPIAVQWWAVWYPGAEPGGGGYVVQRMLSAKNERHAVGATLMFNFFHYALRPWPWILVALASLIVYPDIASMADQYPGVPSHYVQHDFAYPAMLREFLPSGLLGLVVASIVAAYMSTTASHINWGSSYLVNDFYARFYRPDATEKQKVRFGRISTVCLMVCALFLALLLQNALQAFQYILMIGAGTGIIYILRWFWWRINAYSEISAMVAAGTFSLMFIVIENFLLSHSTDGQVTLFHWTTTASYWNITKLLGTVILTTTTWVLVTFLTKPVDDDVLRSFYERIRPGGPGWRSLVERAQSEGINLTKGDDLRWDVPTGIICMISGTLAIYSVLFCIGNSLYGNYTEALILAFLAASSSAVLVRYWNRLQMR
ncbi:Na+:solute symporter [Balneolales bacterium ANBcel1]|nr:Na+:solute symporter [Balneolales bacterium ANBcel1]